MTSLLLWKEHLKRFYNRYSYGIQPVVRFLFALCTMVSLNTNIGYMAKLKSPLVILPVCLVSAFLPYGAIVFLAGCLMIAHVYAVSLEMALIAIVLILTIAILYYGFKPGDSYLMVLTPLAFLFKIPYVVPLLVGLGGSLASVIPVGCGVFLYYLLIYVKQNAGILAASDGSVDIVQKYSQILKSVLFNQTMMVMIATCAVAAFFSLSDISEPPVITLFLCAKYVSGRTCSVCSFQSVPDCYACSSWLHSCDACILCKPVLPSLSLSAPPALILLPVLRMQRETVRLPPSNTGFSCKKAQKETPVTEVLSLYHVSQRLSSSFPKKPQKI